MIYFKPCWSCGSTEECYDDCECAKCVDPDDYADWKNNCPEEYHEWLEEQRRENE